MPRLWKQFIQMTRTRCACETNERWLTAAAVNGVSDEDAICAKYGVTKIETVAEEYVACVGQWPMMTMISHAENQGKRERQRETERGTLQCIIDFFPPPWENFSMILRRHQGRARNGSQSASDQVTEGWRKRVSHL